MVISINTIRIMDGTLSRMGVIKIHTFDIETVLILFVVLNGTKNICEFTFTFKLQLFSIKLR